MSGQRFHKRILIFASLPSLLLALAAACSESNLAGSNSPKQSEDAKVATGSGTATSSAPHGPAAGPLSAGPTPPLPSGSGAKSPALPAACPNKLSVADGFTDPSTGVRYQLLPGSYTECAGFAACQKIAPNPRFPRPHEHASDAIKGCLTSLGLVWGWPDPDPTPAVMAQACAGGVNIPVFQALRLYDFGEHRDVSPDTKTTVVCVWDP